MEQLKRLRAFFEQRYPVARFTEMAGHKKVPIHRHMLWYYLGGIALVLLILQLASGALLLLYYHPTMEGAFESVRFLMTKVEFGWLVRSIHVWSANLLILAAFFHLASTFFLKAYRPPRELTWVSGVVLLFLLMGFGFTGYLLPWSTLSLFATKVGTEIAGDVPWVGSITRAFLLGGEEVGEAALSRFFWLHIVVLPALLFSVLGLHLLMIQLQGMSKPMSVREERSIPFFPNFLLRDLISWMGTLGLVLFLSVYDPALLGEKADPFAPTPVGTRPEWYFLWMFQTLKLVPARIAGLEGEQVAIVCFGLAGFALFLVPWMDRPAWEGRSSGLIRWIGILAVVYLAGMTAYALWPGPH